MFIHQQSNDFDETLFEQLATVRTTGAVNMMDRRGVWEAADVIGLDELSEFLVQSPPMKYLHLLRAFDTWLEQKV